MKNVRNKSVDGCKGYHYKFLHPPLPTHSVLISILYIQSNTKFKEFLFLRKNWPGVTLNIRSWLGNGIFFFLFDQPHWERILTIDKKNWWCGTSPRQGPSDLSMRRKPQIHTPTPKNCVLGNPRDPSGDLNHEIWVYCSSQASHHRNYKMKYSYCGLVFR